MSKELTKGDIIQRLNSWKAGYVSKSLYRWTEDDENVWQAIRRLIETQPDKYKIFHDHIKAHFEKEHPDWRVVCKICGRDIDMIFQQKNAQIKEGEGKSTPQNIPVRIKEKEEG